MDELEDEVIQIFVEFGRIDEFEYIFYNFIDSERMIFIRLLDYLIVFRIPTQLQISN